MAEDRSQVVTLASAIPVPGSLPGSGASATISTDKTVATDRSATPGEAPPSPVDRLDPLASLSALAVGEVIGEGGMGVVRTAVQRSLSRTVAIKTTLPDATAHDAERMLQEAWVTGFLEHPGVVPVHDILRGADGPVVVMRRIRGATWERRRVDDEWARTQGARDLLEQNLRVFVRVCEIVEFAHAKGVMHRDLKPANVMLGSFGEVYLLDWGLALALSDEAAERLPRAGVSRDLAGTLAYAAPEMIGAIDAPIGEHTDQYLLGSVLFELATGRPPHDKPTVTQTFESIAASPPKLPVLAPARLAAICARAMEKEPSARYAGVAELRREVLGFLRLRDSEHVVAQAERALEALRAACETGDDRRRIYDLHGECRFAFREALHMWPDNETARNGLATAATLVIERELGRDPRVAVALLDESPDIDPALAARVRAAAADEMKEREGLSRLARMHDQQTGLRARQIFFALLGLCWSASQFADRFGPVTHLRFAVSSLLEIPVLLVAWLVSRDMFRTLFNRRLLLSVALLLVAQSALFFATYLLGVDLTSTRVLQLGLWATVAAALTTLIERRFWPMTLVTVVALAITIRAPELRALAGAFASLTVTANVLWMWRQQRAVS
ncbi:MAG: Serine/threonine protein kinase PrkC, regulator of stationary phase [Labilithrix sp.]|nr:Serine/threonine protein kinase PrkC, regulator of stationary phase [Labilithrix sp.]